MDHSPLNSTLIFAKKSKSFTTARKSMSKLVKLPSSEAKCCKIRKIYACEVCKFFTLLYYVYHKMAEIHRKFSHFVVSVIQKYTKLANFASVYFPCFTIFRHQTFTNFNMLFLASVKGFDIFAKMKIQFKRGMVNSRKASSNIANPSSLIL